MKVFDIVDGQKRVFAFEVFNLFLTRSSVVKIVKRLPGAKIMKAPKSFSFLRESVFCEFEIAGQHFQILEPFGDNSRYWIGPKDNAWHPEIEKIKNAFLNQS